jgi:branched-chain amino acid transport system permease protein
MFGWSFGPQLQVYYLIAFWLVLSAIAMYALTRTPLGRISNAVRDNPERVQFIGYDPHVVRYIAYCFAGFFAGVAGGLTAINFEIANSALLGAIQSGLVLFSTFIGGTAFFFGPILGAILVTYLQLGLTNLTTAWQLYFGIIFIGIVMYAPGGIAGLLMMHRPLIRAGTLWTVIPSYLVAIVPTVALACGVILVIETVARFSGGDPINLFGIAFNPTSPVTWLAAAVLVVGGGFVARLTWLRIADAWDRAATVARDRGYLA